MLQNIITPVFIPMSHGLYGPMSPECKATLIGVLVLLNVVFVISIIKALIEKPAWKYESFWDRVFLRNNILFGVLNIITAGTDAILVIAGIGYLIGQLFI